MVSRNRESPSEILAIFRSRDSLHEPLTTGEVADTLDCSRRAASDRLERLVGQGDLDTRQVGAEERVWWLTEAGTSGGNDDSSTTAESAPMVEATDAGQVGVFILDEDDDVAWVNEWVERYFDVDRAAIVGRDRPKLVRDELSERVADGERFRENLRSADGEPHADEFEFRLTTGGERRWLRHYSRPIETGQFAGGRVEFYYDIHDEKPATSQRLEREEQFRSLVQATDEYAIFLLDTEGHVVSWNPGAERIKGYEESEIVGEHFSTFYTDDDVGADVPAENLAAAREEGSVEDEGWRVRQDGTRFWANVTITAIRHDDGTLRGFAKVTRDMTDRREWERQLEEERNLLDRTLDAIPVSVGVVSTDLEFVRTNERASEHLGVDALGDETQEVGSAEVYDESGEFVPVDERPYVAVFETGEAVRNWHCQIELPERGRRWLSVNAVPLFDDDGAIERVVVCADDVTQLKEQAERLETQLGDLEDELDDVFERVSNAFFGLDDQWRFTYVNERAEEVLGRDAGELIGESIWEAFPETVGTEFEANYREAMDGQQPVHFEAYHPSTETWFEVDAYPSESGLSVHFSDVTGRKEREHELERYERIVDNVPVGVYRNTPGPDGEFVEANDALASIFGADSVEELMEHSVSDLYVDRERREEFSRRLRENGMVEEFELRQETLDGERIWISVTAIRTEEDGEVYFDGIVQDVTERKERQRELRKYETLFEESKDVNAVIEPDGTYGYLTPSTERVLGYDPAELVGENAFDYIHPDDREEIWTEFSQVVEDPDYSPRVEMRFRRADGSWAVLEAHARNLLDDPDIEGIVAYTRDISERKEHERALEQAEQRYRSLAENFPDGAVGVYDEELRYTLTEGSVLGETLPGKDALEGSRIPELFPEDTVADLEPLFRTAIEDGETRSTRTEFGGRNWRVWATPLRDAGGEIYAGLSFAMDITEQVRRERDLEQYETIIETVQDGVYVLDDGQQFVDVNDAYVEMTGYSREELLGSHASLVIGDDVSDEAERQYRQVLAGESSGATIEADILRADGTRVRAESNVTAIPGTRGESPKKVGVVRDISERIERERELEESRRRYSTVLENFPNGAVAMVDRDLQYLTVGGESIAEPEVGPSTLEGSHVSAHLSPELADAFVPNYQAALDGETNTIEMEIDDTVYRIRFVPVRDDDGDVFAALGMSQDVTPQIEYERELEARLDQQDVIAELGRQALENPDLDELFEEATERVAETLDNEYCKILDLDRDSEELLLRSGVGWKKEYVGSATVGIDRGSQAGYTLIADEPVVVDDMDAEERFSGPDLLVDHGVESGISAIIGSRADPWGVLGTHDTECREFSDHEALFVQTVANILATAIDRRNDELELEDQRERLAALNNLNAVVRDINEAIADQSTQEEIERTVCGRLAGSESYSFAWTAGVDPRSESVDPRVESGTDDYLDDVAMSVDEDEPIGQGPTGQAVRTTEMQVTNDALHDPDYEPWRDAAKEYDFRSSAAIPIVHEDTLYGVLGVYTERVGAFADEEREVLAQLGELIGHAIAAVDRKRALMSDELVELEFHVEDLEAMLDLAEPPSGRLTMEQSVPVGDDAFLVYGTASDDGLETLESLVERLPHWDEYSELETEGDENRFEVRLSEPPVLSMVASYGGSVDLATIEDGAYTMTLHLPPTVDVRTVIERIQETYPQARMVTRKQVSQSDTHTPVARTLTEELTDRQRAALEASFHAGFFEWPRESSGEEVADSLDVSAPTFHQHLRKAQQKLLEALLV